MSLVQKEMNRTNDNYQLRFQNAKQNVTLIRRKTFPSKQKHPLKAPPTRRGYSLESCVRNGGATGRQMEHEAAQLMRALAGAPDTETTIESLKGLVALIERSHGAAAEELAAALRTHGAVQRLCVLVDDAAPSVHRRSMAILGNLVADVFDPRAGESVALARAAGVLPRLMARLGDETFPTKLYAAACLQNMTSIDGGVCDLLNSQGAAKVLEALLRQPGDDEVLCTLHPCTLHSCTHAPMHPCTPAPCAPAPLALHSRHPCGIRVCVQLVQFASGTLANMLSRGTAELEDEGETAARLTLPRTLTLALTRTLALALALTLTLTLTQTRRDSSTPGGSCAASEGPGSGGDPNPNHTLTHPIPSPTLAMR